MRKFLLGALCALLWAGTVFAQSAVAPCKATTVAPSYVEGSSAPCSMTLGGATRSELVGAIAGERNTSSSTLSYLVVRQETNLSVISKTSAVTIGGGQAADTHLMGVQILAGLTGTCVFAGFQDSDGVAQSFTIPVAATGFKDFFGAINAAGALTVTCSNAADDNLVLVLWRPR